MQVSAPLHMLPWQHGWPELPQSAQLPDTHSLPVLHMLPEQHCCPVAPQEHIPPEQVPDVGQVLPEQQTCPTAPHMLEHDAAMQARFALQELPEQQV